MGIAKRMELETQRRRLLALELAIESGALKLCPHGTPLDLGIGAREARTYANRLLTRRSQRVAPFTRLQRKELLDLVEQMVAEQGRECAVCRRY